jgi:hypothetical protein
MVNPGAFRGLRKTFLMSHKEAYSQAIASNSTADFLVDLTRRYFKRFPVTLPHDQEPSPEHLASVDDNAADSDLGRPDPANMSKDEYEAAERAYRTAQETIAFRNQVSVTVFVLVCSTVSSKSSAGCGTNTSRTTKLHQPKLTRTQPMPEQWQFSHSGSLASPFPNLDDALPLMCGPIILTTNPFLPQRFLKLSRKKSQQPLKWQLYVRGSPNKPSRSSQQRSKQSLRTRAILNIRKRSLCGRN